MKKRIVFVIVLAALVLAACGTSPGYSSAATAAPVSGLRSVPAAGGEAPAFENSGAVNPSTSSSDTTKPGDTGNTTGQDRLVIMNADLSIVVADPQAKMDAVAQMANGMGGFVVASNLYQTYTQTGEIAPEAYISIRVPSAQMDVALKQIKADAVEVRSETRSGQDVTQAYIDQQSQLRALEAAEAQLTEIMKNATDTQDVLDVFNQIEYYRQQIDVVKGQIQYYEQASDFSLINVTLIAEETAKPLEIGGWKPQGIVRDAVQALIHFLQGFTTFLIWLVLLVLPVIILIFGPIALVVWAIVAAVRKSKVKKAKN